MLVGVVSDDDFRLVVFLFADSLPQPCRLVFSSSFFIFPGGWLVFFTYGMKHRRKNVWMLVVGLSSISLKMSVFSCCWT